MGSENRALQKLTENPIVRLRWNKFRFDIYIEVSKAHMRSYQNQLDIKKKNEEYLQCISLSRLSSLIIQTDTITIIKGASFWEKRALVQHVHYY